MKGILAILVLFSSTASAQDTLITYRDARAIGRYVDSVLRPVIAAKADTAGVMTRAQGQIIRDAAFGAMADMSNRIKNDSGNVALKANAADVYTKTQTNSMYAPFSVTATLASKWDSAMVATYVVQHPGPAGPSGASVKGDKGDAGANGTNGALDSIQYYNTSGRVRQKMKEWVGVITPTTAAGMTIDISSAGFATVTSVQLTAANNTTAVLSMPLVDIKSFSATQVVCNILMSNSTLVGVLNTTVTGIALATNLAGVSIHCRVLGY